MGTWEQQKSAGNSEKHLYNLRNPFNLNYRATLNKHVDEEDRGTVAIRDTPTQKKGRILLYVDSDDRGVDEMATLAECKNRCFVMWTRMTVRNIRS